MSAKLKQVEMLRRLRGIRETMREVEFAKAQGLVRRVAEQVAAVQELANAAAERRCDALAIGDVAEWRLAESSAAVGVRYGMTLERVLQEKLVDADEARVRWGLSRREMEQAEAVVLELRRAMRVDEERRAQAVSDDRFAARAHWVGAREGGRV